MNDILASGTPVIRSQFPVTDVIGLSPVTPVPRQRYVWPSVQNTASPSATLYVDAGLYATAPLTAIATVSDAAAARADAAALAASASASTASAFASVRNVESAGRKASISAENVVGLVLAGAVGSADIGIFYVLCDKIPSISMLHKDRSKYGITILKSRYLP